VCHGCVSRAEIRERTGFSHRRHGSGTPWGVFNGLLVLSRTDADDVLQEVAIVLWAKFEDFRDGGGFQS